MRKPPKVLQISPPALLVTTSDFSPMNLCSPSLPTASLTPAVLQVIFIYTHQVTTHESARYYVFGRTSEEWDDRKLVRITVKKKNRIL